MIFETKNKKKNVRSIDRLFSIVCCATDVCILLRRENQNQNKNKKNVHEQNNRNGKR